MNILISIDGACRDNGKPHCVSSSGAFVTVYDSANTLCSTETFDCCEEESSNQRGEMKALILALSRCCYEDASDVRIITDSEYIFNAMTKQWYARWQRTGWKTANGDPVKNQDLWEEIISLVDLVGDAEISYYHIKGHIIPTGAVTSAALLSNDKTGLALMKYCEEQYDKYRSTKVQEKLEHLQEVSEKNNGFPFEESILRQFVVMNSVADVIAVEALE